MKPCWVAVAALTAACGAVPQPVAIDPANDGCARCRMIAADTRLAAQIVAPGDEPLIFDDIGCLRDYLAATPLATGSVAYVADHRTGEWVRAEDAVFTRTSAIPTSMGSGLVAHADRDSRDADPVSRGGEPVDVRVILTVRRAGEESR